MIIRNVTNCIKGGYLAVITGDSMDSVNSVILKAVETKEEFELPCINKTASTVTFRVPKGKYQTFTVSVKSDSDTSNELKLNVPQIKWILEDGLYPGKDIKIIGHGFVNIDLYKERENRQINGYADYVQGYDTKVFFKGVKEYEVKINNISNYEICGTIPQDIEPGEYIAEVRGTSYSDEYKITIEKKTEYPNKVFNVLDYGAKPIPLRDVYYTQFFDSAPGFQKALDAAHENGGGTVFIPRGRYCFKSSIRIYPYTKLIGEDRDRVWLELPKGMSGEDGWGTFEEGEKIYTLIAGESGDFTIENISMMGVYSPILIAAPMITGEPLIGDDIYNRAPLYSNLIDDNRDADNIIIRNCNIIHEPTFLEHRKKKNDPFRVGGYDNRAKKVIDLNENYYARLDGWTAIAIKGDRLRIENNKIQGAGSCIRVMGTNNATFKGNELLSGDLGNCFGFFATSYNPNVHWKKQIKNIVMEDNLMKPLTNVTRGVMWIMEDHSKYFMKGNKIDSFFYMADNEGFCFHLWGKYLRMYALSGDKKIKIDMKSLLTEGGTYDEYADADVKNFKENVFKDYYFYVVDGKGIGQKRRVISNGNDFVELDKALDCELDNTSIISISDVSKFTDHVIVKNEVAELGRGIYTWGSCCDSIIDQNVLHGNSGILLEDLSWHYDGRGPWQHAGHLFNQIINNKMTVPRGFCSNYGVVGVSGGTLKGTTTSVIIRGNVCEDDTIIVAKPRKQAKDGLNYAGVVIENNKSVDCEIGIEVDENISATISQNEFENVDNEVVDCDSPTIVFA